MRLHPDKNRIPETFHPVKPRHPFKHASRPTTNNWDIFAYMNSKFIYVERHLKTYPIISSNHRSQMPNGGAGDPERTGANRTRLSRSPLCESPVTVPAGETLHIIQCIPRIVQLRRTEGCFHELPITFNNKTTFLKPRTHIITRVGTRRKCNELLPTLFRIHAKWYRLTPRPAKTTAPPTLEPFVRLHWKYIGPYNLATGGI